NLSRVTLNQKGVIDLNAPLPSIDYGKVVQTLYAPIGQAFAATARQMNRSVADIQRMVGVLKKRKIGVLITDHNVRETLQICDLGYLLSGGKILE
ncbi:MAG: hypothetical protein EBV19_08140, partial [Flavobacteriia bacterium]|nr:hypothetical protein [Flavobacteriia bacterium]